MHWHLGEIYFDSRKEALTLRPWMKGLLEDTFDSFTPYQCDRCGVNFASQDPSTDTGGIICGVCEKEVGKNV